VRLVVVTYVHQVFCPFIQGRKKSKVSRFGHERSPVVGGSKSGTMNSQQTIAKSVSRPHQYKCGVCSEEGHNSRNCPLRNAATMAPGKSRMMPSAKNNSNDVLVGLPQHQQAPSNVQMMHGTEHLFDGGMNRTNGLDMRGSRGLGGDAELTGHLGSLRGPFAQAVASTKRRVIQCADNVANVANNGISSEDYNAAVNDLVSAMDCLERVVKCAIRFNTVVEGGVHGDPDASGKRRRKDYG